MTTSHNSNAISLSVFAAKYSLPLRIKVLSGYCGFPYSISNEEIIEVKRKEETEVILAITHHSQKLSIPVNLKLPLSVVHDYRNDMQEATAGYEYNAVEDLMLANPCPQVVCARRHYNNLLEQNEVLIVKGLSIVDNETMLNVYSTKHKTSKLLPKNCIGLFTTSPMFHELHVSDIVEHNLFPCKVVSKAGDFESSILTLAGITTQQVLICTNPNCSSIEVDEEFELPTNLPDVTVAVIEQSKVARTEPIAKKDKVKPSASVFNFRSPVESPRLKHFETSPLEVQHQRKISLSSSVPNIKYLFESLPSPPCSSPTTMEPPEEDVYLSLQRFVDKYSFNLPATINVTKRNHSHIKKRQYTVHFITYDEVVSIKDDKDNVFILKLDDKSEFGLVYEGNKETVFETIQDILNHTNLPKIICALHPFKGKDAKSSVETEEVLVIRYKTKRNLKVYSITAKMKKKLSANCKGYFTTAPHKTKLTIRQFRQYLSETLPATVVAFQASYPHILTEHIITFAQFHTKNSLVASFCTPSQGIQFTSIPLTAPIEVCVTGRSAADYESSTPYMYDYIPMHPLNLSFSGSMRSLPLTPPQRCSSSSSESDDEHYVQMDPPPVNALSRIENIEFLRSLSHVQIIELLEKMGLSQYKDTFIQEEVDGVKFSKLKQIDLCNDFGIENEHDISKIMMVASAQESAKHYFMCS